MLPDFAVTSAHHLVRFFPGIAFLQLGANRTHSLLDSKNSETLDR